MFAGMLTNHHSLPALIAAAEAEAEGWPDSTSRQQ